MGSPQLSAGGWAASLWEGDTDGPTPAKAVLVRSVYETRAFLLQNLLVSRALRCPGQGTRGVSRQSES